MNTLTRNICLLGLISVAVSGCSTLSKGECLAANWKNIGYKDGTLGYQASRISQHRSACAEYNITPDPTAYTAGRNEGLAQYCTPVSGYNTGLSGDAYNGVCSNHNEKEFVEALNFGLAVHRESKKLESLRHKYNNQLRTIAELEKDLRQKERELTSGSMPYEKSMRMANTVKEIFHDLKAAKASIGSLQHDVDDQAVIVAKLKGQKSYH